MTLPAFDDFRAGIGRARLRYAAAVEREAQALGAFVEPLPLRLPVSTLPADVRAELDAVAEDAHAVWYADNHFATSGRQASRDKTAWFGRAK